MIGCLWTHVRRQPITALYFESETVLKLYNLEARFANAISPKILCTGPYNAGEARDINFGPQRKKLVFGVSDKVRLKAQRITRILCEVRC